MSIIDSNIEICLIISSTEVNAISAAVSSELIIIWWKDINFHSHADWRLLSIDKE